MGVGVRPGERKVQGGGCSDNIDEPVQPDLFHAQPADRKAIRDNIWVIIFLLCRNRRLITITERAGLSPCPSLCRLSQYNRQCLTATAREPRRYN
jgi:hypothetical protein